MKKLIIICLLAGTSFAEEKPIEEIPRIFYWQGKLIPMHFKMKHDCIDDLLSSTYLVTGDVFIKKVNDCDNFTNILRRCDHALKKYARNKISKNIRLIRGHCFEHEQSTEKPIDESDDLPLKSEQN